MDEARRFLRYVIPGLVFGTHVVVLLLVLLPTWSAAALQGLSQDTGVGVAVAVLVASGGLGFVFGAVHHALHWQPWYSVVDHRPLVQFLHPAYIEVRLVEGVADSRPATARWSVETVSRRDAWLIVTTFWYQRIRSVGRLEAADPRTIGLTDSMHSLGTAFIAAAAGSVVALALALLFSEQDITQLRSYYAFVSLAVVVPALLLSSYRRTGAFAQRLVAGVMSDVLSIRGSASLPEPRPVVIHLERVLTFRERAARRWSSIKGWVSAV
jgi:hypothetical protein